MSLVPTPPIGRRPALSGLIAATIATVATAARGQAPRPATPRMTEGPFYPADWQGDVDNDLVAVQGEAARAMGQVVHLQGRVLDLSGQPLPGTRVEIWQCDARGIYRHPADERGNRRSDRGFQGRGRTVADAGGRYSFRTIRPVAYSMRTPHIHFRVDAEGRRPLITQMFVEGEALNGRDFLLNAIDDRRQRDSVLVRLDPAEGLEAGAQAGRFDIVLA